MVQDGVELVPALAATLAAWLRFALASGFAINDAWMSQAIENIREMPTPHCFGGDLCPDRLGSGVLLPALSILTAFSIDVGLGWILLAYGMLQVLYNLTEAMLDWMSWSSPAGSPCVRLQVPRRLIVPFLFGFWQSFLPDLIPGLHQKAV